MNWFCNWSVFQSVLLVNQVTEQSVWIHGVWAHLTWSLCPPLPIYPPGDILESLWPPVHLSSCPCVPVCSDDISWTAQPFLTRLGRWCIIMRWCVTQKNRFTIFNVKVTGRAYIIKIWLFQLYLLNCWFICNQTGFKRQHHKPECPVKKMGYCVKGQGHSKDSKS